MTSRCGPAALCASTEEATSHATPNANGQNQVEHGSGSLSCGNMKSRRWKGEISVRGGILGIPV
jgi:hypothetical protein